MPNHKRAFIDFYGEHKISPVSQNISDLKAHFDRREALYRHLGVIPSFVQGKSVIEFGPGSGHNALYTASLMPSRYVFVEGNPTGLEETKKKLENAPFNTEFVKSHIESFETDERFDMVLCEGVLPWQNDPTGMMQKVAEFVAPGGILIVTTNNEVSALSETLRQLQAALIVDKSLPIMAQVEQLLPVFKEDLNSLKGMSRPQEDWILDQILQPFIGSTFSIEHAIRAVDGKFDVYSASPNFLIDWAWYKEVPTSPQTPNELGISTFRQNIHNFLDYRYTFPARSEKDNLHLDDLINELTKNELLLENSGDHKYLPTIQSQLAELTKEVRTFSSDTAECLEDFANCLDQFVETGKFPTPRKFSPFFGRGQQYLSFIKK